MCTLCAQLQTFTPECNLSDGPLFATIAERGDAAGNTSTNASISVGDSFTGSLTSGDADCISISLTAGISYQFDLLGLGSGGGSLIDPYLRVYDANGNLVASNDDAFSEHSIQVSYSPPCPQVLITCRCVNMMISIPAPIPSTPVWSQRQSL